MGKSDMIPFLDLRAELPLYAGETIEALETLVANTQFVGGEVVEEFQKKFSSAVGVGHTVGCSNGTVSLVVALLAMGCSRDSKVIVAANSFIATAEAVSLLGAEVIFVDVEEDTGLLDIDKVTDTDLQEADFIVPTHLYGQMLDMEKLSHRCHQFDVKIIEDAAQAHLATYDDFAPGVFSGMASYSFYPGKNLGAWGDAGAVTTNVEGLSVVADQIANHGSKTKYDHVRLGGNFRIASVQAAVLSRKLDLLKGFTEARRAIAKRYLMEIRNPLVRLPRVDPRAYHVYHLFVVRVDNREKFKSWLDLNGVGNGIHYPVCLHHTQVYSYPEQRKLPVAEKIADEIISIPVYPMMRDEEVNKVIEVINAYEEK